MKKNGQYVGVDEKYVPEDEKYIDSSISNKGRKKLGTAYVVYAISIAIVAIAIIAFAGMLIFKIGGGLGNQISSDASNMINETDKSINVNSFNFSIESYSGTQYGSGVSQLLDNVITNVKKNTDHSITVSYNNVVTSNPDEMTTLKKEFDSGTKYEVSLDYDSNGYINKVTISNY